MRQQMRIKIGVAITLFGLLLLVDTLLAINLWAYLWPLIFIAVGIWLILNPPARRRLGPTRLALLGDVRRHGRWSVRDEDIWILIGDAVLDFTQAKFPEGEATLQLQGLVGDVHITIPEDLGIKIRSTAFVTNAHVLGSHQDYVLTPYEFASSNYATAPRRVNLEILHFVTDLRVRRAAREA